MPFVEAVGIPLGDGEKAHKETLERYDFQYGISASSPVQLKSWHEGAYGSALCKPHEKLPDEFIQSDNRTPFRVPAWLSTHDNKLYIMIPERVQHHMEEHDGNRS
jgi:hypothetical protein